MADPVELTEVTTFLKRHEPFAALPEAAVAELARRMVIRYARRGTKLLTVGRANHEVFVVRSGAVEITDEVGELVECGDEGTTFGTTTIESGGPARHSITAIEDTLVLVMTDTDYRALAQAHPTVAAFFSEQRRSRLTDAVRGLHTADRGTTVLQTRLGDLVRKAPVCVEVGVSIRAAAQVMSEQAVSSLIVMAGDRLAGIVTDRDLRNRVVAAGRDLEDPVDAVMTARPVTAPPDMLALELILEMTRRNIHHVPVVDGATPIGMITTTDLVRLEQDNPVHVVGEIGKLPDAASLASERARLGEIVHQLVRADATADGIGRIVTAVGDAIQSRLVQLAEARFGPPPLPYCWVALGSQARFEQSLSSDQDNAIILSDEVTDEHLPYYEQVARFVVDGLAECGYPYCTGEVMATNPMWRVPVRTWRRYLNQWINEPVHDAVVNSGIFFDMRAIRGDDGLVEQVFADARRRLPESRRFLSQMAASATVNEPPLGFFRGFVLQKRGENKDLLDLKHGGVNAIVELARVHALANGLPQVSTGARLQAAAGAGALSEERASDLADAFAYIRWTLLAHQAGQVRAGREPTIYVSPADLTPLDRRHLRDSFQIIREAQHELSHRYATAFST